MDDVLTSLIHLGYLSYDRDSRTCRIPNREVATEFKNAICRLLPKGRKNDSLLLSLRQSKVLIYSHEGWPDGKNLMLNEIEVAEPLFEKTKIR